MQIEIAIRIAHFSNINKKCDYVHSRIQFFNMNLFENEAMKKYVLFLYFPFNFFYINLPIFINFPIFYIKNLKTLYKILKYILNLFSISNMKYLILIRS